MLSFKINKRKTPVFYRSFFTKCDMQNKGIEKR